MNEAVNIANVFINKLPDNESMSKIKLQKLLFFAQEEYLFRKSKALFDDKIYAWEHGPVVKNVWDYFNNKETNSMEIEKCHTDKPSKLDDTQQQVVDDVWDKYGEKEHWSLEAISHSYKIWKDKYQNQNSSNTASLMTPKLIEDYKKERQKVIDGINKKANQIATTLGL